MRVDICALAIQFTKCAYRMCAIWTVTVIKRWCSNICLARKCIGRVHLGPYTCVVYRSERRPWSITKRKTQQTSEWPCQRLACLLCCSNEGTDPWNKRTTELSILYHFIPSFVLFHLKSRSFEILPKHLQFSVYGDYFLWLFVFCHLVFLNGLSAANCWMFWFYTQTLRLLFSF